MYSTGAAQQADAIAAHPYPFVGYNKDFLGRIRIELARYRKVMSEFGDSGKPIWVTEVGLSNADGYTDVEQADALVRTYTLFRRITNIPVVVIHRFVNAAYDIPHAYGVLSQQSIEPAYCAMAAARETPCPPA